MTRAYINIRPNDSANYITIYHNGDQYPKGIKFDYGLEKLIENEEGLNTKEVLEYFIEFYGDDLAYMEIGEHPVMDSLTDWNYRWDFNPYNSYKGDNFHCEIFNWDTQELIERDNDKEKILQYFKEAK